MKDQRQQYWINLLATFMSQAFTAVSIFILTPVLLANLGERLFGYYGIILNLILFAAIFDFGLNIGLLRRLIHEKEKANTLISTCSIFFVAMLPIVWVLVLFLLQNGVVKGNFTILLKENMLISLLIAFWISINMLTLLFDIVLQSLNKIFVGKLIRIGKTILEFGLVWWISAQQSILLLIIVVVIVNLAYLICMYTIAKKALNFKLYFPADFYQTIRNHLSYSIWYWLSAFAGVLVYNAQTVLMGSQLNANSVAKFLIITRFYEVIRVGLANFTLILFPTIAMKGANENWKELLKQFKTVFVRICLLAIATTAIMCTLGERIFKIWSGYTDTETLQVYRLYTLLIMFLVIEHVSIVFLSALKQNKLPTLVSFIQGFLGLILSYFLMQRFGLEGAVIGSLIAFGLSSFIFNPVYLFFFLRKNIKT